MHRRKLILSLLIGLLTAGTALAQSEALKGVVNNLAYYRQQQDLKYLKNAKRQVDSLIITRSDSQNLAKSVFKAVVYSSILYTDSLNKLSLPDNTLAQITNLVDQLSDRQKIFNYQIEINFSKRCLSNVYLKYGDAFIKGQKFEEALKSFEKAMAYAPAYKAINGYIGYANTRLGRYEDAAKSYDKLIETDSLQSTDVINAADAWLKLRDTTKALSALQKGRRVLVNDRALLYAEANIYHNKPDYKALEPLLERLINYNNTNTDVAFMAANCYDHLNKFDKAASLYLQVADLKNSSYDAAFNLALLYFKQYVKDNDAKNQNINRAIQWFEKANTILPNNLQCLQMLQWAYLKNRNADQLNRITDQLKQLTN